MTPPKVAILIPTMNRSDFLIRQLRYYASVNSPHPIYIGDASNEEHRQRIQDECKKIGQKLTIHYHHWPEMNDRQTIAFLGETAEEKYCAFTGDDDFLIPDSLIKCAEFLEIYPDYGTAQGRAVLFTLKEPGPFGAMNGVGPYWSRKEAEEKTAAERLLHFGRNYWVPQFSVHRQNEFLEDSINYRKITDKSFGELLHSFTFISKGKSKFIDCLYLIRQGHDARYVLSDALDWLTGSNWQPSFQLFMNSVSEGLVKVDNIKAEKAKEVVKQAFRTYLLRAITKKHKYKNKDRIAGKLFRDWIKGIPGTKMTVNMARTLFSIITSRTGSLSLPALLRHSSPYHKDFMPVYAAITKQPVKTQ